MAPSDVAARTSPFRRRSGLQGVTKLRRKLRRIDKEVTQELRDVVSESLDEIERDALGLVPVDAGDLAHSIEVKISSDGFTGIVGPGAKAAEIVRRKAGSVFAFAGDKINLSAAKKHDLFQFFKGYWIEFGTKGSPEHNIPPQPARPFMTPAYEFNRPRIRERVKAAIDRILQRVANG